MKEYKITLSENAEKNLEEIIEYLMVHWSETVKNKFLDLIEQKVGFISANPFMYPKSKKKNIRKCLVTKHNAFYYCINKNEIEIITFYDTRKNQKKLKF